LCIRRAISTAIIWGKKRAFWNIEKRGCGIGKKDRVIVRDETNGEVTGGDDYKEGLREHGEVCQTFREKLV